MSVSPFKGRRTSFPDTPSDTAVSPMSKPARRPLRQLLNRLTAFRELIKKAPHTPGVGIILAFFLPQFVGFVMALANLEGLRTFLQTAPAREVSGALWMLAATGYLLGGVIAPLVMTLYKGPPSGAAEAPWAVTPRYSEGTQIACAELAQSGSLLDDSERQQALALVAEIRSKQCKEGSDWLDRRVLKALRVKGANLKPTQSAEDAEALARLRVGGVASKLSWDVKLMPAGGRTSVELLVARRTSGAGTPDALLPVTAGQALTVPLSIVVAVLLRESLSYTLKI